VCLLHDVAATAREALGLVPHSQGRHYGDGKLRLCSDLDVLAAAFDARLEEVYASGVLARVVARPGVVATREDVWFYMRNLLARLRVGSAEMRREAAATLGRARRVQPREVCPRRGLRRWVLVSLPRPVHVSVPRPVAAKEPRRGCCTGSPRTRTMPGRPRSVWCAGENRRRAKNQFLRNRNLPACSVGWWLMARAGLF
jgi:hypothetical protein